MPVNAQIAGAPAGSCVLGNTQYTIQVPSGATQLTIVLSGDQDVDLFVRFNQMVAIAGGQPVADFSSTSLSGNETITITPSSSPPLQTGTYFIAIGNCSTATANFTLTATVTTQGGGGGGGCSGGTPLTSGTGINAQIAGAPAGSCVLGNTQYTIQVPSGATQLTIVLSGDQDVDLFVRFNQMVAIAGGQPVADFSSTSLSGNETITITPSSSPPLQQGCYFIAIGNCSTATANFTLTATVTTQGGGGGGGCSGGTPLTSGTGINAQIAGAPAGSCVLGNTQYTIQVPSGATQLTIVLSGDQDVDLFVRFNQMVAIAGGQPVADHSSTSLSGNETITITPSSSPPLRQGCYFIAIGNCSTATANFTLTATVSGGPQSLPTINLAFVSRKHVIVAGMNFDAGAVIVMNGVDRKTRRDPDNPNVLTGKKLAKKIEHGQTVMLQVRNSNGAISPVFPFTRP
ncbi:MAG: pre-peptidase C-terminal domain-containing protein [Acidobacteriota bacterium]